MTRPLGILSCALSLSGCFHPDKKVLADDTASGTSSASIGDDTTAADSGPTSSASTLGDTSSADTSTSGTAATTDDGGTTTGESTSGEATSGEATTDASSESSDSGNPACVVDGVIGDGEECDDDNEVDRDGCSDCWFEDGWGCTNQPSLCFPACNPLVDDCGAGQGCYALVPTWACTPSGSGQQGEPCANINGCDAGFQCVSSEAVTGCDQSEVGCCTTVCDATEPTCPGGLGCALYYDVGRAPPGLDDVGVCI
ncbi:MAG TPA: hypothetical protein VG755_02075 [Nannocystaceae bacterium]|nr:hypothetical protein [Nannocystaceae bacterium]